MQDVLHKKTVLVLNRNWQAIHVRSPAEAFCQLAANVAVALNIDSDNILLPVKWDDWIKLPVRANDQSVQTVRGPIRVPTVIIAGNYGKVPRKRPKLSRLNIQKRDGFRCQYTGRILRPDEGNVDHIVPVSRGGITSWENCVWACREINSRKANHLPREAGLKLLSAPRAPREVPATLLIENTHQIPDWDLFLHK